MTRVNNDELVDTYAALIEPLLPLAKRAYGSRDTVSPEHYASRRYTKLLTEFVKDGGSLGDLSKRLGVAYSGMRRRVQTAELPKTTPTPPRHHYTTIEYTNMVHTILEAKRQGTERYHEAIKDAYDRGYSIARVAREMGLSSANPLYYAINKLKLTDVQES